MSNIDSSVASLLDSRKQHTGSDDEDALFEALENETSDDLSTLREKRLQQLHEEFTRAKYLREGNTGHGEYQEIKDEKDIMDITTSTKLCVVHFFKPDFNRCRIMDRHLATLAPEHLDTRFVKINVENAPFLVTKLKVQVLPCVIAFKDGVGADRIIGFEGLADGSDSFTSKDLESRLLSSMVLLRPKLIGKPPVQPGSFERERRDVNEDEEDDDWD